MPALPKPDVLGSAERLDLSASSIEPLTKAVYWSAGREAARKIIFMTDWGIPSLLPAMLATVVPTTTYAGGPVADPEHTVFVWRSATLSKAHGCTVCFYRWDSVFESLWKHPHRYIERFVKYGVGALVECDFSLWVDDPIDAQVFNVFRARHLAVLWQEAGLKVIPSLNWSDERSYAFAFQGVPRDAFVVATECRTAGSTDSDRRAFLTGLAEGIQQVQPQHVIIYGGGEHAYWLTGNLPHGPEYTLLPSWTHERNQHRRCEKLRQRNSNQLPLLIGGTPWSNEAAEEAVDA
jgi:hypothetical protein